MNYQLLEPSFTQQLGLTEGLTFVAGQATSLFASVSFVWTLGILICVAATGFVWIRGGLFRMEASESGIRKSNEEFKRGSFGLLGVLLLFLIIYTINKGLLLGDVGLDKLGQVGAVERGLGGVSSSGIVSTGGGSCAAVNDTISAVTSGSICAGYSCRALNGCNYQQYQSIINQEAASAGVDPKVVIVLMCKESSAKATATHLNYDGTYDCGLMQINQPGSCG